MLFSSSPELLSWGSHLLLHRMSGQKASPRIFLSDDKRHQALSCLFSQEQQLFIVPHSHSAWPNNYTENRERWKQDYLKLQIKNTRLRKTQLYGYLCNLWASFLPVYHGRAVNHIITGYFSTGPWPHPVQQNPGCSPSKHPVTISSSWHCWRCGLEPCLLCTSHILLCSGISNLLTAFPTVRIIRVTECFTNIKECIFTVPS